MVPGEPPGAVLQDHAVALRDGLIEAVLPCAEAEARFAGYPRHDLSGHALIPGLVNINPAPENPESMLQRVRERGVRAAIALPVKETPSAYASDPDDYLAKGLALRDRYRDHPLVSFCLAPLAPSDETLRKVAKLAAEVQVPVHVSGVSMERLAGLGLLGPEWSVVDPGPVEDRHMAQLERHGVSVIHRPATLSRTPVARMAALGVNIALGADDLLPELRIAALPAPAALHAATLGGARALGLENRTGSIVAGKAADLTAIRISGPGEDPVAEVVYVADAQQVSDLWVAGTRLLRERRTE